MVVTRSSVSVQSPTKTESDRSSDVQATPSTGRRTRRTAADTHAQPHENEGEPSAGSSTSTIKRSTRASRCHSPQQPSTPVESTNEADESDLESCSSVVSDKEPLVTRLRSRRRQPHKHYCEEEEEQQEVSESESCSSAVSASNTGWSVRRSTRKKTLPKSPESSPVEKEGTKFCSTVASGRITRSHRKAACTKSTAKQPSVESEASDADSCISSVSAANASITRRVTRSTRRTRPIPIYLDEASESSQSPAPAGRRTRTARGKPAAASVDASQPQSCDSEGFESGPIYSTATALKATDSESELADLHPPNGSRGTSCSGPTGSGNSLAAGLSVKDPGTVVEADDSRLDSTEDADCTMLVDEQGVNILEDPHLSDVGLETAETNKDQREELSTENKDRDASKVALTQELIPLVVLIKPCPSVSVTVCDQADEKGEAHEETHSSLGGRTTDEDAGGEAQSSVVESMEVSTLKTDDQHVADSSEAPAESILVASKQQHEITVISDYENTPTDITVQKAKAVSLLDSSDDEDSSSQEEENEEDHLECREGEGGGTSAKSKSAGVSVDGLFMIDTRPGEDTDEHYYKDTSSQEQSTKTAAEQEDEEFIDEEGDDEDDEDTQILYSSRDLQAKELSSRIDPGLKVKALGGLYINFDGSKSKPVSSALQKLQEKKIQDEVMKKSVIGPDFETKDAVPPYKESKRALKRKHREERAKSTGEGWFNMKAPELTPELKGDLQVLKIRGSLDPKRFYKKNDRDGFPKYFQVGTVVDSPVEFYHSRVPKKQRKRTMVEELLADAEFRHKNKKKFQNILMETAAQAAGKKNKIKNKKKFNKKQK